MKRKIITYLFITLTIMILNSFSSSAISNNHTKIIGVHHITPTNSDNIEIHYKYINGKLYMRYWSKNDSKWLGNWIPV